MERLPDLVHERICECLSYDDLLNLRLTCKLLRYFVDQKQFKKLILFYHQQPKYHRQFPSDRLVGYANSLRFDDHTILRSAKFLANFGQVASLIVNNNNALRFRLNLAWLAQLHRLEHLELNAMTRIVGRLELANLRAAAFYSSDYESAFELDCPKLEALNLGQIARASLLGACDRLTHLQVNYLQSDMNQSHTRKWYMRQYDMSGYHLYLAALFSRLPYLSTVCFEEIIHLNDFLSAILDGRLPATRLSRVELKHCHFFSEFGQLVDRLTRLSERPETEHVRFFMNGEPLCKTKLDELHRFIERQMKDTSYTQKLFFYESLVSSPTLFNEMKPIPALSCLFGIVEKFEINEDVELDAHLIHLLKNVQQLTLAVRLPLDDQLFDLMLSRFKLLKELCLGSACLRQEQLDRLPDHFLNLTHFNVRKEYSSASFHFLDRFKSLTTATFASLLEKNFIALLFRRCELLEKVCFLHPNSYWRVEILKSGKIRLRIDKQKDYQFASLQASLDFYSTNLFRVDHLYRRTIGRTA